MDNTKNTPDYKPNPMGRAAIAYAILTGVALLLLNGLDKPLEVYGAKGLGQLLTATDPTVAIFWGVSAGLAMVVLSELLTRYTSWGRAISRMLKRLVGHLHPADILLLALLSSVGEELIFRGLVLPYIGLASSSVIFGLLHFLPRKGLWVWSIWASCAGYLLGILALYTGGLLAPIIAHFTVNLIGLYTIKVRRQ